MNRKCPVREGKNVIKRGKRNNKQGYHCTDCFNKTSCHNRDISERKQLVWFQKWIIELQVYKYLGRDSGVFSKLHSKTVC